MDKQRYTIHYTENYRSSDTNPTENKQRSTIHYTENYRSSDTNPTKSYVIFRKGIIQFYNFTKNKSYQ